MKNKTPINSIYHEYLRQVLQEENDTSSLFIATKEHFSKSTGIAYPYRSNFYTFGVLHNGSCELQVGISEYKLKKNSLTLIGPGIVRSWTVNNRNAENTTVFFKPSVLGKPFFDGFLGRYDFFKIGANHVITLSEEHYETLCKMLEILQENQPEKKLSSALLYATLEFIDSIYNRQKVALSLPRNEDIVRNFTALLNEHYRTEKQVSFYAQKMALTPKHLSKVLSAALGKTAKQAIDDLLIFESQSLLKQTSLDIEEIMYWLGYDDTSYFSKLFKNNVGKKPSEYRSTP